MSDLTPGNWLDRPVDDTSDHILGPAGAPITLVEYGSYACPYCRAANERIAEVRDQFGNRIAMSSAIGLSSASSWPAAPPNWWSGLRTPSASGTRT